MTSLLPFMRLVCCAAILIVGLGADSAMAANNNQNCPRTVVPPGQKNATKFEIGICAQQHMGGTYQDWEFTRKLVDCIEGTIRSAVFNMMSVISSEFAWLTGVMSTLVVMFFGVRVATGERDLLKRGATLAIKLAFVTGFMTMLPQIVNWVFGILDQLLTLVVGGVSPWTRIDTFLGELFGFGPSIVLLNGLVGLVGAAIFSSKVGMAMFFFGVIGVLNLLNFILALIYTYCMAFLTIGFLLVLTPVVIPLALFFHTERYFKKWTDIIVSAMLTPILLFAFVWMFIGIFDILIQEIFNIIGGKDLKSIFRMNTSLFSWVMPSDPNTNVMMQNLPTDEALPCVDRTIRPAVQTNINPLVKNAFNVGSSGKVAMADFGANDPNVMQRLGFIFTTLWIFSSLMKSMVGLIPQVASSIAAVASNIAFGGGSSVVSRIESGLKNTQSKLQSGAADDLSKTFGNFTKQMGQMIGNRNRNK